jgi:hypothetical protein
VPGVSSGQVSKDTARPRFRPGGPIKVLPGIHALSSQPINDANVSSLRPPSSASAAKLRVARDFRPERAEAPRMALDYPVSLMRSRRSRLSRYRGILPWLAVASWMLVIFILSSLPELGSGGSGNLRFGISKVAHVILYSVLGFLVANAIKPGSRRWVWWTFVICELYAIGDEIHQSFIPGRTPTDLDLVIDGVSALAASLATPGILRRISRRDETSVEGGLTEVG